MYLKHLTFNHETENINYAMGLTPEREIIVRERIMFHTFAHHLNLINNHYPDTSSAPANERTSSGLIQNLLQSIHNQHEYEVSLYMFDKLEKVCDNVIKVYIPFARKNEFPEHIRHMIIAKLEAASAEMVSEKGGEQLVMSPINVFKRIELVAKSGGNFDTYMKLYQEWNIEPVYTDADDILKSVFTFD